jgi:hypothetical protein
MNVFLFEEFESDDVLVKCQNFLYSSLIFSNKYRTEGVLDTDKQRGLCVSTIDQFGVNDDVSLVRTSIGTRGFTTEI